jgi:hypothetical protein
MKCWRNLSHECAGDNCPMWMEGFDLSTLGDDNGIGINESKCAMVLKEKTAIYRGLLDIMDFFEGAYEPSDEDIAQMIDCFPRESSEQGSRKKKDPRKNKLLLLQEEEQDTPSPGPSTRQRRGQKKKENSP